MRRPLLRVIASGGAAKQSQRSLHRPAGGSRDRPYYYRNRYYAAETGRFTSPDPLGLLAGPNLYTYVNNNPVNWVDPWGLMFSIPAVGGWSVNPLEATTLAGASTVEKGVGLATVSGMERFHLDGALLDSFSLQRVSPQGRVSRNHPRYC